VTPRIQTIVCGVDLSVPSEQALERAAAIALLNGAQLILVHAQADDAQIPDTDNEVVKQLGEVSAAVRAEEARRLAVKLDDLQGRGIKTHVIGRAGSPGDVVSEVAKEHAAELIVVGTHGHTGIQRFLLGSVATAILRHAPCDVLVHRGPASSAAYSRPLVASDFSPAAIRALHHAASLTAPGATIEVIHAWQLPAGSWGATLLGQARFPWNTVRDAVLSGVKAQAEKLVESTKDLGHPIHVELVQGPPPSVITHAAERGGHDLIAIGTHGHRGFRRLLLGSVAENVIRHAPCSVLVAHGENAGDTSKFTKI
jgi:nucleotide-binding universal stress UspA family protein